MPDSRIDTLSLWNARSLNARTSASEKLSGRSKLNFVRKNPLPLTGEDLSQMCGPISIHQV